MAVDSSTVREADTSPPSPAKEAPRSGQRVGRYYLLEPLGRGGMGVVHLGYDPQLHRRVAIKVLRTVADDEAGRGRLVREAQALAQLSHPNLVHVYDVGRWGNDVFIAMEYVRGKTLADRIAEGPMPWPDAVALMIQAGHGLVAAHRAGFVHRDFKPGNVLLGDDAIVRVADFGLARLQLDVSFDGSRPLGRTAAAARKAALAETFSREGVVLGTVPYMAPEQHASGSLDPRSDEYSFCVTLYELLAGARPFRGRDRKAVVAAKLDGPPPLPSSVGAPAWLRRLVARGLSPAADDRYPTLAELVEDLERRRQRRGRRIGLLGLAVAGSLLGWVWPVDERADVSCDPPALSWELRRDEVTAAFAATSVAYAPMSLAVVDARLDAYASRWRQSYRDACEATHVHGRQSGESLDLRMACLERRRAELDAIVDVFARADAAAVERAAFAVADLTDVATCEDLRALQDEVALPDDPTRRREAIELDREMGRVAARAASGDEASVEEIERIVQRARDLDHPPAVARAVYLLAETHADDPDRHAERLREAIELAAAAHDDALAAQAWIKLIQVVGADQRRPEVARELTVAARAAVRRAGSPVGLRADLEAARGRVLAARGQHEDALVHYREATALVQQSLGPDDPRLRTILFNHGAVLLGAGRLVEARAQFERALAHGERTLGRDHPYVAQYHSSLATVLTQLDRHADAQVHYRRALQILEREPRRNRAAIATARTRLSQAYLVTEDLDRAEREATSALANLTAGDPHDDVAAAAAADVLGSVALARDDAATARAEFERARDRLRPVVGTEHPNYAEVSLHLADAHLALAHAPEALEIARTAEQTLAASLGSDHALTRSARLTVARARDALAK